MEYQSKLRFSEFGIPIPPGKVAHTAQQVFEHIQVLAGSVWVTAQMPDGRPPLANGVHLAATAEEARRYAEELLQEPVNGPAVQDVLIEPVYTPLIRIYLGIRLDRAAGVPVILASADPSPKSDERLRKKTKSIIRENIDLLRGLLDYQIRNLVYGINLPREYVRAFGNIAHNLYDCYLASDALVAEIDPLVITSDAQMLALNTCLIVDDNALFRHKDLSAMQHVYSESVMHSMAREAGMRFVKLDGQIGCVVNGAGLALTTLDLVTLFGAGAIRPANCLDVGGDATAERVTAGLRIALADPDVQIVLVNIFGGITRCDEVAQGILDAYHEAQSKIPLIVRLEGAYANEGRSAIDSAGIPHVISAASLTQAAQQAVAVARGS